MSPLLAALIIAPTQTLNFAQLEEKKVAALNSLTGFRGTYVMVSIPYEGVGIRQEVTLTISPDGRRTKLQVNGTVVGESAYNKKTKWTAIHQNKSYQLFEPPAGFKLPPDVDPLKAPAGQLNLTLDDLGPRFATNPDPTLTGPREETVEGKKLTRYDAKTVAEATKSQVQIIQWFDPNSFIVRRFEIIKTTDGKVSTVKGFLVNDTINTKINVSEFDLPADIARTYKRVDG